MDKNDNGLERLCKVYLNLSDNEKETVIRLAEGLLNSQKIVQMNSIEKSENTSLNLKNCKQTLV